MSVFAFALVMSLTFNVCLGYTTWLLMRAQDRCQRYAVRQAERRDVLDPAGRAYSDMATVIVLDGKVRERAV